MIRKNSVLGQFLLRKRREREIQDTIKRQARINADLQEQSEAEYRKKEQDRMIASQIEWETRKFLFG